MMKLMAINERYEFNGEQAWSENGDKYILKLFRDYVFHQVDRDGNPVLDPGHMIRCLNKMDVGTEEKVNLTSRDAQTTFIISYRELKKMFLSAFGELQTGKPVKPGKNY
jgi:PAB-dependent poly(A)-specific ribonuclease subunit 3